MKKYCVLFSLLLGMVVYLPVQASVTVNETTDPEYLINSGYSQASAEEVFVVKRRANGESIEPLYENTDNKFVKVWKRFWAYVDPARETYDSLHHDIQQSPSNLDL